MNRVSSVSLVFAVLFLASPAGVSAQDASPTPPFVAALPDTAEWIIKYPAAPKQAPLPGQEGTSVPRLVQVVVTKKDKVRRERSYWTNDSVTERWLVGDFAVFEQLGAQSIHIVRRGSNTAQFMLEMFDLGQSDFPELQWIDAKSYVGIEKVEGRNCYLFSARNSFRNPVQGNAPQSGQELKAWVDIATRLPVALLSGDQLRKYTFASAPGEPFVMPDRFQQALDRYLKVRGQAISHEMKVN